MPFELAKLRARALTASVLSRRTPYPELAAFLQQLSEGFAEEARKREEWLQGQEQDDSLN